MTDPGMTSETRTAGRWLKPPAGAEKLLAGFRVEFVVNPSQVSL